MATSFKLNMLAETLQRPLVILLNHLVGNQSWAQKRLQALAGKRLAITLGAASAGSALARQRDQAGGLVFRLSMDEQGFFNSLPEAPAEEPGSNPDTDVVLSLPADAPARLLLDPASLFSGIRIAGPADVTENLAFVFRNLRWDVEADLARVVGDIPARRLHLAGQRVTSQLKDLPRRLLENLGEYASEEARLVTPAHLQSRFASEVSALRDDVARLEKRLNLLAARRP